MAAGDPAERRVSSRVRLAWIVAGVALLLAGVLLPTAWYDHIPRNLTDVPNPPFRGVTLLRISLGVEGLVLIVIGLAGGLRIRLRREDRISIGAPDDRGESAGSIGALALITFLGAVLRFYRVGSDLWLDEITTVLDYRSVSAFHVVVAYVSSNNHLLNTLLIKLMTALFGPAEWALRLPAVCFGIATIPAVYLLARVVLGRVTSLLAAFFLAVSYHHVFFSQNARGYAALLFFSVLGTAFFLRALRDDRKWDWALYVIMMFLAVASVLYAFFVLAGHGLVIAAAVIQRLRGRDPVHRLLLKSGAMWGIVCALALDLYASIIPQVYSYLGVVYKSQAAGYAPYSPEAVRETLRGIAAGFGGGTAAAAVVVLLIVGAGFVRFARREPMYTVALSAPLAITAAFILLRNLTFSPRFFLWGIPVAMIFSGVAVTEIAEAASRRWNVRHRLVAIGAAVLFAAVSARSLAYYYRTPKQPSRQAVIYVAQHRQESGPVAVAYLARWSFRFYGPQYGLVEGRDYIPINSYGAFRAIETAAGHRPVRLVRTFPRALRLEYPQLASSIDSTCRTEMQFPATVRDGDFEVLTCRSQ